MNVTFLIGNGFDLNSGLKSSYHDIYKEYVKQPSSSNIIAKFKNDLWDDKENWGDFEVAMSKYIRNFTSENDFLVCLRDFIKYLEQYLTKEAAPYSNITDDNLSSVISEEMYRSLTQFHKGVTHDLDTLDIENANINAIVFNYTSVIDDLYDLTNFTYPNLIDNIVHIHGRLNDDVIMGMDNISQLTNMHFHLSRKSRRAFIKSEYNNAYDKARLNNAEKIISESDVICIFGMSLSESDLRWRNLLLSWLRKNKNVHLFLYQYECSILPFVNAEQRLSIEEDQKEVLLSQWGVGNNEIDLYFDNIHIPCCKNIFNFKDVIEKETIRIKRIREQNKKRPVELALKQSR